MDAWRAFCQSAAVAVAIVVSPVAPLSAGQANGADLSDAQWRNSLSLSVVQTMVNVRLGEPILITMIVKNTAPQAISLFHGSPIYDYSYTIIDENDNPVARKSPLYLVSVSNPHWDIGANSESHITVRLDDFMALERPGSYTMTVSTKLRRPFPAAPIPLTATPVTIVISPPASHCSDGGDIVSDLRLSLTPSFSTALLGEPILGQLTLCNVGNDDMAVSFDPLARALRLTVLDRSGHKLRQLENPGVGGVAGGSRYVGALGERDIPVRINAYVPITEPGTYAITATLEVWNYASKRMIEVSSKPVTVQVVQSP